VGAADAAKADILENKIMAKTIAELTEISV